MGILHLKVSSSPSLFGEGLNKLYASRLKFVEHTTLAEFGKHCGVTKGLFAKSKTTQRQEISFVTRAVETWVPGSICSLLLFRDFVEFLTVQEDGS